MAFLLKWTLVVTQTQSILMLFLPQKYIFEMEMLFCFLWFDSLGGAGFCRPRARGAQLTAALRSRWRALAALTITIFLPCRSGLKVPSVWVFRHGTT